MKNILSQKFKSVVFFYFEGSVKAFEITYVDIDPALT